MHEDNQICLNIGPPHLSSSSTKELHGELHLPSLER